MGMNQGITILPTDKLTPSAIIIHSTTVIGLVASAVIADMSTELQAKFNEQGDNGLLLFNSPKEALEQFKAVRGTVREDLVDIVMQNVSSPIVISLIKVQAQSMEADPSSFYDVEVLKSRVIDGVKLLKSARTKFGRFYKVRVISAGWWSHDADVRSVIESQSNGSKVIGLTELRASSVQEANKALDDLGNKRNAHPSFYNKRWSTFENKSIARPTSAAIAGHIAYWDGALGEFGFAYSHGNRPIYGMTEICQPDGTPINLTYEEGETCDVNMLANNGGLVIFNDNGWELYNFESSHGDETENKLEYIRFFDGINEAIQQGLKEYAHRPFLEVMDRSELKIEQFLGKAVKKGVALGFDVWLSDTNSGAEVQAGNLYLSYKAGNNPAIRAVIVKPWSTTEYADAIVKGA